MTDAAQTPKKSIPIVSRVLGDTLVELTYDAPRGTTALVVSRFDGLWNLEQELQVGDDTYVPYAASNNLISNECVMLPARPDEYGSKPELLVDIRAFLHRYVDLSSTFEHIAAHYVLLTWVYDRFGELPYLRFRGDYGTGKTRALLAIGSLCNKGFFASAASTTSPIFHTLDAFGGTLLFDEADFPFSDAKADMVKILNNGTVQGIPVLRTIVNRHREFNPAAFKVFGPKIVAMRDSFQDRALESRFITEETGARPLRSDIPLQLPPSLKIEALALRNRLLHFRLCEYFHIHSDPTALIAGVDPRLNQTALSLLSLVDDSDVRDDIRAYLIRQDASARSLFGDEIEGAVVKAAFAAFDKSAATSVAVRDIAEHFNAGSANENGAPVSNKWIGYMLRTRLRLATHKSGGIYVVPASERPRLAFLAHRFGIDGGSTAADNASRG